MTNKPDTLPEGRGEVSAGASAKADQALVNQAPAGLGRSGFDPSRMLWRNPAPDAAQSPCPDATISMMTSFPAASSERTMVERIARAIAAKKRSCTIDAPTVDRTWTSYVGQARAVLMEMLEPTQSMVRFQAKMTGYEEMAIKVWVGMIAGALHERTAQGMETRSAETGTGSVRQDDSPVRDSECAQPQPQSLLNQEKPK